MSHDQPQAWRTVTIEDLGQVVTGRTPPSSKPEMFGSEYPFITPSDMSFGLRRVTTERSISLIGSLALGRIKLPPKSVAFVCIGATIGKVCLTSEDSFTNQQINSIVVDCDRHSPEFVYYLMLGMVDKVKALAGGAATPIVNKSSFCGISVSIPPIEIQSKIAFTLSAYDDLIENNTRRIEILEEMARRLYEEWFVQFRFPGHEGVEFKESLPSGWAWVSIEDAADNFDRLRKPLSKMQRAGRSGSYPYYGAAKVFDYIDDYLFEGRYLLMAEDGSVITPEGHPVLQITHGRFWVNNHTHILKGRGPFSTEFIYLALSTYQVAGHITGAAQPKITQANMNRIPVLRATNDVHASFDAHIGPVFDLIETLERKNVNLRAQRDLLLPKLISGEIDVSDIPMPT
ncbi:restriction endonuclease subunit S [Pseudomonas fulva]|uniref:restriction endonuclease subunit S n=1 Tax=Pseudomonas fulva TaxID=47880 RepID=UPI002DB9B61B|nr:restriction endonuclease subunit S [Pseudomonas fulva]MEB8058636.1 restriction endonuclease subunit S [Pseudomonas fulva]